MRTTLTLEDDVVAALKKRAKESGATWKELVNALLRAGLAAEAQGRPPRPRYETTPVDSGPPRLPGVHSVHDLLAFAEGEDFR